MPSIKAKSESLTWVFLLGLLAVLALIIWHRMTLIEDEESSNSKALKDKYLGNSSASDEDKLRGDWRQVYSSLHSSYEKVMSKHEASAA